MRVIIIFLIAVSLASCVDKRRDKFLEAVKKLRNTGLFEGCKNLDDEQLANSLIVIAKKRHQSGFFNDFDEVYDPEDEVMFTLHVAELDPKRVWWHDLEREICKENLIYRKTIEEFSKLSGGFLKADDIQEKWESDTGVIEVSFMDSDTQRVFNPEYHDDWYDPKFFSFLEKTMASNGSPYILYMHEETGQDVFLIRATAEEKRKIEKVMSWRLVKF
jgi:hypothetical protein